MENGWEGEARLTARGGGEFMEMVAFTSPNKGLGVARGPTNGRTLGQESGHKNPQEIFGDAAYCTPIVSWIENLIKIC
jgi:hypothetical protein